MSVYATLFMSYRGFILCDRFFCMLLLMVTGNKPLMLACLTNLFWDETRKDV